MAPTLPATNVRVCSRTVQDGDVVRIGLGTSNITDVTVVSVDRWFYNGYCNANLTLTNGERLTMWAHTYYPAIRG